MTDITSIMFSGFLNTLSPVHKGMLFSFVGYAGYAWSDIAIKYLAKTYQIYEIITIDMLLATALLLCVYPYTHNDKTPLKDRFKTPMLKFHILRGILNFIVAILFVTALVKLPMAMVYTLVFTTPFCAVIITTILYKEKMRLYRWISIVIGFIGVLVVVRPSVSGIDPIIIAPLATSIFAALMFVVTKSMTGENDFKMGIYPSLIAGVMCIPLAVHHGFVMPAPADFIYFLISGIGINIGIIFVSKAYAIAPSASVSPFHYSQILWGLSFGYLVFAEIPDYFTLLGAVIIIGSGLFLVWHERKHLEEIH